MSEAGINRKLIYYSAKKSFVQHGFEIGMPLETLEYRIGQSMKKNRPIFSKRLKGYSAIGYRILSNGSQTLFNATEDLHLSSYEGQIFNGNTSLKKSNTRMYLLNRLLYIIQCRYN